MSEKQRLLDAVAGFPDSVNWSQITEVLLNHLANIGAIAEYARVYRAALSDDDLAEYATMKPEHDLAQVVAEIEARHGKRGSA